jgi:hypothetical protein
MPGGGWGRYRPIAAIDQTVQMLRCCPSDRTFAAIAKSTIVEFTQCGLSDHLPVDRAVFSISPEGSPNGARQNLTLADKEILTRYLTSLRN